VKFLSFFAKLMVSVAILWFVTRYVDWYVVAGRLQQSNPWLMAAAVGCLILQNALAALRWRQVILALGAPDPGFGRLLASYFEGLFIGQVLPATVGGDVLRVIRARGWQHTLPHAAGGVLLERVFSLACLVAIGLACLPWLWRRLYAAEDVLLAVGVIGVWAVAFLAFVLLPWFPGVVKKLRFVRGLITVSVEGAVLMRRVGPVSVVGITSTGGHMLVFAAVALLARGLGLNLGFGDLVLVMPLVILIGMTPISFAGWGVREGAMAFALGWFGVPTSDAVLLSILVGFASILSSLPGAAVWCGLWPATVKHAHRQKRATV
jgi:uncharacterized membrane protein YbhN (UPF0104 family)